MAAAYIALEGPDGVGKSTVATALKELLLRRTAETAPSYSAVRIRHFPTDALTRRAVDGGCRPTAEDYLLDMENWLSHRPEPAPYPDAPTHSAAPSAKSLCILDRWALSAAVYARLRDEPIPPRIRPTLNRLNRVPLATFVLLPKTPEALTDPDYPGPAPYNPRKTTEGYRAFVAGEPSGFVPIVVDRAVDTPDSVAAEIAERMAGLQTGMRRTSHTGRSTADRNRLRL